MKANPTKQRKFRLFFSILLAFIATQSFAAANNNLSKFFNTSSQLWDFAKNENYLKADCLVSRNTTKLFNDVTIQIYNYAHAETDIYFYNQDTCYSINVFANDNERTITIPEGQYDVDIWSTGIRSVYLGYWQNRSYYFEFDGVYIDPNNNIILID